jgi:hypothetical protein
MHSLINANTVGTIRKTGNTDDSLPDRTEILKAHDLPFDQPAENIIITGCQITGAMPQILKKYSEILGQAEITHTFLSMEFCCGNNLYRPAIKAKDDEAMTECRSLSKEFVSLNIKKAKELGAKRIIIFCSSCYPIYKHAFPEENIVFYPQAISEAISDLSWSEPIDYYAGCYRLHKKFSSVPMDLKSTNQVFKKIHNLSINRISAPTCCFKPDGLDHMLKNVQTKYMVHVCTGCYLQALINKKDDKDFQVLMLPEFIHLLLQES